MEVQLLKVPILFNIPIIQINHLIHVSVTVEDIDRVIGVNLRGVILCYKHAARQMIKQGRGGRILGWCLGSSHWTENKLTAFRY